MDGALERYEILGPLGYGGTAEVSLARQWGSFGIERLVAVKRLRPDLAGRRESVRSFREEASLSFRLQHPNVVEAYDILGDATEPRGLVLEFLHGASLVELMRRSFAAGEQIPIAHAVHVVIKLCAALQHLHDLPAPDGTPLGLVHRDISPPNVMITFAGQVKLIDFGFAQVAPPGGRDATRVCVIQGRPSYLSPEQCRGARLDRRSDVFSAGILLWEMICSRKLFPGEPARAVLKRVESGPIPLPSHLRPECPAELEAIVMRALERDPARRTGSAGELALALKSLAPATFARATGLGRWVRSLFPDRAVDPIGSLRPEQSVASWGAATAS
jgi:serine/threonine protein kinase